MRLAVAVVALWLIAITAVAQTSRQLIVTVVDPTEQAVPGVTVTVERNGAVVATIDDRRQRSGGRPPLAPRHLSGHRDARRLHRCDAGVRAGGRQSADEDDASSRTAARDRQRDGGGRRGHTGRRNGRAGRLDHAGRIGRRSDPAEHDRRAWRASGASSASTDCRRAGCRRPRRFSRFASVRIHSTPNITRRHPPSWRSSPTPSRSRGRCRSRPGIVPSPRRPAMRSPSAIRRVSAAASTSTAPATSNNRASVNFFGNINSGKEDQPIYAQTPAGPVRGLVDNSNRYHYGTLRVGLDNWRRNDLRFESDYQNFRTLNVGAGGFNLAERGFTRDQTTVRARSFWTKPLRKGGSQVLRVQYQHRFENNTPVQHGAGDRRAQRVFLGRRAVSGHAHRQSDRSVRRRDAAGRHETGLAGRAALLARRLRQLHHQQRGRHVHVLVARRVHRRAADDVHAPARRAAVLLRRLAAGTVGAGRHRGVEDDRDVGRAAAGIRERHVAIGSISRRAGSSTGRPSACRTRRSISGAASSTAG